MVCLVRHEAHGHGGLRVMRFWRFYFCSQSLSRQGATVCAIAKMDRTGGSFREGVLGAFAAVGPAMGADNN